MNRKGSEEFIFAIIILIIIVVVFVSILSFFGMSLLDYVTGSMETGEEFFDALSEANKEANS